MENLKVNNKTLMLMVGLVLVMLILLNVILKSNRKNDSIDYKNTSAETLMYSGTEVKDRQIYFTLESIISKYILSFDDAVDSNNNKVDLESDSKYSYKDYYEALTDEYRDYLGEKEYIEVAKTFLNKFFMESGTEEIEIHYYMDVSKIIKEVYKIDENMYVCKLTSSYKKEDGYIGIYLDEKNTQFEIFIIE